VTIASGDDTDSPKMLDSKFYSEHDSDVDICMEDNVDAPDGVHLDSDMDMERERDNDEEKDSAEEDKEVEEVVEKEEE
jgi:hypothetical protein